MIEFVRLTLDQARESLAPMVNRPKWDTSAGLYDTDDVIGGGVAYLATDEGGPLVVFVVQQIDHAGGRELVIRVARQVAASGDATERVLPEIERVFGAGCAVATIYTKRAGLVHKLARAGYSEAAKIMRKSLL